MKTLDDVTKEVSKRLKVDRDIVDTVCKHVFGVAVDTMKSDNTQDILFNTLFKFKLKTRFKEDKQRKYSK